MNDKMRKASQLVIGGALCLSLVTGCAKVPDSTPAISKPAVTEPSATTKATKPTAAKPAAKTKATTAPAESKATEPSATTTATQPPETKPTATTAPTQAPTTAPTAAPTTAPTEAPTTAPTEAPTEATTAPTEAPQISLDYNAAMAAGNAYGVSAYGWTRTLVGMTALSLLPGIPWTKLQKAAVNNFSMTGCVARLEELTIPWLDPGAKILLHILAATATKATALFTFMCSMVNLL